MKLLFVCKPVWVVFCTSIFSCVHSVHSRPVAEPLPSPLAENASKVRMALVRGHSVALVSLLQRRAQETTGRMQQWLEEHYQAEMKRYGSAQMMMMMSDRALTCS